MNDQADHSVWDVYDLLRTARLNVKYYSARIARLRAWSFWLDLILGIAAPSSAVAALWFWETEWGRFAWKWLAVIAAVIAVVKPLLRLGEKTQKMEEALTGYKALDHDLTRLTINVKHERAFSEHSKQQFREALARRGVLVGGQLEFRERKRLKRRCEEEVMRELPAQSLYVPQEDA